MPTDPKRCSVCKRKKPASDFNKKGTTKAGKVRFRTQCKQCLYVYQTARLYKISEEDVKALLKHGRCMVCQKRDRTLAVDHNHTTGLVRGILCRQCNSALGLLGENPMWVLSLLAYLNKTDPYEKLRLERGRLALLALFSVVDDVLTEHDAFASNNIYKSLGRIYREWLNAREALDPTFDRQRYRHEMKSKKTSKKKTTPLGRSLPAKARPRSSTGSISTSGKSQKKSASQEKQGAKRSARRARSDSSVSGGPSRTMRASVSGVEWHIVNENVSASGSRARASEKSQSLRH